MTSDIWCNSARLWLIEHLKNLPQDQTSRRNHAISTILNYKVKRGRGQRKNRRNT